MGTDGVEHLIDTDCLELLGASRSLNKHLLVQVVVVLLYEVLGVSQQDHDVDSLSKLLTWQV